MTQEPIKWDDELSTGIMWQDIQHRELIGNINSLRDAIIDNEVDDELARIKIFLDSYISIHFSTEQRYMSMFEYPLCGEHLEEHSVFVGKIDELKKDSAAEGRLAAASLCYDLYEWFKSHILSNDMEMAAFLKKKGVV